MTSREDQSVDTNLRAFNRGGTATPSQSEEQVILASFSRCLADLQILANQLNSGGVPGLIAVPILENVAKAAHLLLQGNQHYLESMAQSWKNRD